MIESVISTTDIIEQLRGSMIASYDTGSGGATVTNIVTALLAFQKITPAITVGTIAPTATVAFNVSNITILNALYQLREMVGGYISVDTDKALQWANDIGEDTGQQIRLRKNLKGIVKEVDWGGIFTRLYPSGSGITLSDNVFVSQAADKDADVTYGYLTLGGQYACYKGWTAAGAALPATIDVYRESAWVSLSMDDAGGTDWVNPTNAVDDNTGTQTSYTRGSGGFYSSTLTCEEYDPVLANGVRFYIYSNVEPEDIADIIVKIEVDSVWTEIYNGVFDADWWGAWHQIEFDPQIVSGVSVRLGKGGLLGDTVIFLVAEVEIRTNYFEDTSFWLQGADERTLRCAIGDYKAGDDYYISYTHADFLKAWDAIATYDDIAEKKSNNKIAYADALLVWGRLVLTVYKVLPVNYEVKAIMLSECGASFAFEDLHLGSIVNAADEELGIDVDVRVVRIDYPDLLDPINAVVELSNRVSDITDTFKDIYNKL